MNSVVHNLITNDTYSYSCTPREAVIAAFAQYGGNKDYNTWDYAEKYGSMVRETPRFYCIGDFAIAKEVKP